MVALSAAALVVSLAAGRAHDAPRERSWDQVLSGFSASFGFGPSFPLPLGSHTTGVRAGVRTEFRLGALGPADVGLVLPVFGRWRAEDRYTTGGAELMPGLAAAIRPLPSLRVSLEGGFGMLMQAGTGPDGSFDATALAARVSVPVEWRLTPKLWLMVMPSLLRDITFRWGYLEVMAGVSWRYG